MRIDSHVCYSPDHPPGHLQAILARNKFESAILVVDRPPWPAAGPHISAILVRDPAPTPAALDRYQLDPRFRGICAPLTPEIPAAARELARRAIPLDVEMRPAGFPALLRLAESLPELPLVIDHLARPSFLAGPTAEWLLGMESAARLPNVVCKISGLLTEVERLPWSAAPLRPFVEHALAVFGPARLMFGSEWPVRLPDIAWKESLAAFTQAIGARPIELREQLLGGTARAFYSLPRR